VIHEDRHQRFLDGGHRRAGADGFGPEAIERRAANLHQAVEFIGLPEGRISLAQATTYLATAPKSNASYLAIDEALDDVRSGRLLEVPEHLKNVHVTAVGKEGLEVPYKYPHDFDDAVVPQDYLPVSKRYYRPSNQGYEETLAKRMEQVAKRRKK